MSHKFVRNSCEIRANFVQIPTKFTVLNLCDSCVNMFLCLRLSGVSPVPRVPRGEVLALGFLGLPDPFSGLFLCGFGVFRVRATVGTWLSRSACPRCPPFPPMVPCMRRARRARRARLFFWLSGCP